MKVKISYVHIYFAHVQGFPKRRPFLKIEKLFLIYLGMIGKIKYSKMSTLNILTNLLETMYLLKRPYSNFYPLWSLTLISHDSFGIYNRF